VKTKNWFSKWSPTQILIFTFLALIVIGSLLLSLPVASRQEPLGFVDALFTATSAVCVTGLVVVDTLTQFTLFGQIVIILLVQLGGLGLMTIASMMAILLGRRISLRNHLIMQEALNQFSLEGLVRLIKAVGAVTFLCEGMGAVVLTIRFLPDFGWPRAVWYGIFHSVAAFCNAGFDLMGGFRNLAPYVGDWLVNIVIMSLIIVGGLGFSVILEIWQKRKDMRRTLSLHARIVISASAWLILFGAVFILIVEWDRGLAQLPWPTKVLAALFHAVAPRTAGFSTLPLGSFHSATLLLMTILMFIGASPGSTGGGVKTTTFGTLLALVVSSIRGHDEVRLFNRRIPDAIVRRSVAIITIALALVLTVTMLISLIDGQPFLPVLFEATSALATVGYSLGLTPLLTPLSRLILTVAMFIGRLGPMSFAFALAHDRVNAKIRYPEEKITVG